MTRSLDQEPKTPRRQKETFTSLSQIDSRVIRADITLPSFVGEIGINVAAMEKICRIAGLRSVHITSRTDEEISSTQNTFVGINRDGTANQAQVTTRTVIPEATSQFLSSDEDLHQGFFYFDFRAADWADIKIELNTAEIAERIRTKQGIRRGVADTDAWAQHINSAIIEELDRKGTHQLTKGGSSANDFWTGYATLMGILDGFNANPTQLILGDPTNYHPHMIQNMHDVRILTTTVLLRNILNYLWYAFGFASNKDKNHPLRFSILGPNAPELDRVAVLKVLSKYRQQFPLVKALSEAS